MLAGGGGLDRGGFGSVSGWAGEFDRGTDGFCGNFFFCGLRLDDLLLWTGDRGLGGFNFGGFRDGFCQFLRLFVEQIGLVGALGGSAVDVVGGAADFSGEVIELGLLGVAGAEVVDRSEATGVVGDVVALDGQSSSPDSKRFLESG